MTIAAHTPLQLQLQSLFPTVPFEFDKPLAPLTYFKVGGPAECYLETSDTDRYVELVTLCRREQIRLTLLGGASNVIVADVGIAGLVLRYTNDTITELSQPAQSSLEPPQYLVQIASGIKMAPLVARTVQLGYTGLEYFLGVPGTLGGAVYNNSHYLSELIGEYIHRVEVVTTDGKRTWLTAAECEFAYDFSRFHQTKEAIVTVEFLLPKGTPEASQKKIVEATQYRAQTQPLGPPSSGCIFRNVTNDDRLRTLFPQFAQKPFVPGGFIIDQAGLKGTQLGGVSVSTKHAAWFINTGSATAADVRSLVKLVKDRVKERFDIELQEEVFYLE